MRDAFTCRMLTVLGISILPDVWAGVHGQARISYRTRFLDGQSNVQRVLLILNFMPSVVSLIMLQLFDKTVEKKLASLPFHMITESANLNIIYYIIKCWNFLCVFYGAHFGSFHQTWMGYCKFCCSLFLILDLHSERVTVLEQKSGYLAAETVIIMVLMTMAVASSSGFFVGYRISRWRLIERSQHPTSGSSTGLCLILVCSTSTF